MERALGGPLAWLICVLVMALAGPAFAQDESDDDSDTSEVDEDDVDDTERGDDDDSDGDASDDDDDREEDAEEVDADDAAPTTDAEQAEADAAAKASPGKVEGDAVVAKKKAVDLLGWKDDDLTTILGEEESYPKLDLGAYVRGGGGFTYRPNALPAKNLEYGFNGRAGLRLDGAAHRMWKARIWLEFRAFSLPYVQSISVYDANNDGVGISLTTNNQTTTLIRVVQAVASFEPWDFLAVEAGVQRIPFTLQQQNKNTGTLFPNRSLSNNLFLNGSDVGALVRANFADGIFLTSLGVWNGNSLGLKIPYATPRGVVLSYRADVNPFGAFPFGDNGKDRGPFRLGVGAGLLWRPTTIFDTRTQTEPRTVQDVRWSASLRMTVRGFYAAAEYFRRHQIDNFTFRPQLSDGAYGQLAYYFTIADAVGLQPSGRVGFINVDQTFSPRLTGYVNAGLSFYPIAANPNAVRIWLAYIGERRFTEREDAHGGQAAVQISF